MQTIRILVADHHTLVRNMLCQLLGSQADFEILCECVEASGAVEKTGEMQPDVVILDISLPIWMVLKSCAVSEQSRL
jgi:two-component system, NarL family, nitrate/nitrite response regulator NarL